MCGIGEIYQDTNLQQIVEGLDETLLRVEDKSEDKFISPNLRGDSYQAQPTLTRALEDGNVDELVDRQLQN
ncbi:hypothetical protein SUGI_0777110 [Cryptomeria japonica]|nr:hypothetical protein SUGI_0777110 [Cryptomeria japonica]